MTKTKEEIDKEIEKAYLEADEEYRHYVIGLKEGLLKIDEVVRERDEKILTWLKKEGWELAFNDLKHEMKRGF